MYRKVRHSMKLQKPPRSLITEAEELVGTGRFELPTPRTPSECSTRLSHVPTTVRLGLLSKCIKSRSPAAHLLLFWFEAGQNARFRPEYVVVVEGHVVERRDVGPEGATFSIRTLERDDGSPSPQRDAPHGADIGLASNINGT